VAYNGIMFTFSENWPASLNVEGSGYSMVITYTYFYLISVGTLPQHVPIDFGITCPATCILNYLDM
jgi:hypothetical protein